MNNKYSIPYFRNKIKELLIEKKMKYSDFTTKVGVKSKGTITNWIGDGDNPSLPDAEQLIKICEIFDIGDIGQLFEETKDNKTIQIVDKAEYDELHGRYLEAREMIDKLIARYGEK